MKYNIIKFLAAIIIVCGAMVGCHKKLDLLPTNNVLAEEVFKNAAGYRQAVAKVYGSMAVTGDIPGEIISDEGNTGFLRMFWYLQCLSTDEAGWTYSNNTDPVGIHQMEWSPSTQVVAGSYYRSLFNISLCNNFIIESTDEKLAQRGITGNDAEDIRKFRAEVRFLKAFNFWVLMDLFGNVPFADEASIATGTAPKQMQRSELFQYLETELKDMETSLTDARAHTYGRVDKAAVWALLSRMYLNAAVYTGTAKYSEAITYAKKVIEAGYSLENRYKDLMLADNHLNTKEFIWTIQYDGTSTQTYSGTTFLVHGPAANDQLTLFKDSSGTNGTWNCIRMTEQLVDKFNPQDIRGQFWTAGQFKQMDTLLGAPTNGYSSTKFRNKTRSGQMGPRTDPAGNFVDIDFPVFRLAEIYLIYAEAVLRGGSGGDNGTALNYLRSLAVRARPGDPAAATSAQLTLPYIIDERARELFWEGHRRTDLIRFNQFTTGEYLWAWKGNVRNGTAVDSKYNLYPIPATDLSSNPNLRQNSGY